MNDVSFSERVKYELCSLDISNVSEARAELMGFIKARGVLRLSKEKSTVSVALPDIRVGRRFLKLMDYLSVGEHETAIVQPRRLWKQKTVEFNLPIDSAGIFKDNLAQQLPAVILDDAVLFGTFLRGVYLSCGSMVDPSISYHMEISNSSQELLEQIRDCLKANFGIESKTVRFRNSYKLSIRRATDLIEFLNLIGAVEAALRVEEIVQKRSVASDVNRSMNFLSANADRIGISTVKQVRAIEVIDRTLGIDSLEDDLKNLARLRIENEDLSLRELGEMMEPKMSKSMVYARMKKIIQLAERIERGQNR
ncbi:DNA-binding protein WhiA [Pseudothermotoga sp. U03pept]|uniref:DNA-binding protein WhiA n=1 Tax=Pseudothermotoga sp. U03pept TaxID=3447012 RepID=UPI003F011E7A